MVDRKGSDGTGRVRAGGPATGARPAVAKPRSAGPATPTQAPVAKPGAAAPDAGPAVPGDRPLRARPIGGEELKAFTHPLRMAMYSALRDYGPATATQLARRLGESSGQTSYHLRQLERHGFVEDDPEHAGGRERWWRAVSFSVADPAMIADPAQAPAVRAMFDLVIADRVRVLRQFFEAVMSEVADDEESAGTDTTTALMTRDEAKAMIEAVQALLNEHTDRAKARAAAGDLEGRRRTRVFFDVVPLIDEATGDLVAPVTGRAAAAVRAADDGATSQVPVAEGPVADDEDASQVSLSAESAADTVATSEADHDAASGHRAPARRRRGGR